MEFDPENLTLMAAQFLREYKLQAKRSLADIVGNERYMLISLNS